MEDSFEIPVTYKNEELVFNAQLVQAGYVHHIIVDIDGVPLKIERDDEGNFRALVDAEILKERSIDVELVKEIVGVLESV